MRGIDINVIKQYFCKQATVCPLLNNETEMKKKLILEDNQFYST